MQILESLLQILESTYLIFEGIAVLVLIVGTVYWLLAGIASLLRGASATEAYRTLRRGISKTLLVTLDLMVIADIILTVTLDITLESLSALGLLVLIRTFFHFTLEVEITGRWPWQEPRESNDA